MKYLKVYSNYHSSTKYDLELVISLPWVSGAPSCGMILWSPQVFARTKQNTNMCEPDFCCNKIPEKFNLRKKRFILGHDFRCVSPWVLSSTVYGFVQSQNIMVSLWQEYVVSKAAHLIVATKTWRKKETEREHSRQNIPTKNISSKLGYFF